MKTVGGVLLGSWLLSPLKRLRAPHSGKRCDVEGCGKSALGFKGSPRKCFAHGGGTACSEPGCNRAARPPTGKCISHGGGKRCTELGCGKGAEGATGKCYAHGGRRCEENGCSKGTKGKRLCPMHEIATAAMCHEDGCVRPAEVTRARVFFLKGAFRSCASELSATLAEKRLDASLRHPRAVLALCGAPLA